MLEKGSDSAQIFQRSSTSTTSRRKVRRRSVWLMRERKEGWILLKGKTFKKKAGKREREKKNGGICTSSFFSTMDHPGTAKSSVAFRLSRQRVGAPGRLGREQETNRSARLISVLSGCFSSRLLNLSAGQKQVRQEGKRLFSCT